MTGHDGQPEPTRPAPRQIRPIAGEGLNSFLERLAAANHLKVRHLRGYLQDPPSSRRVSWTRLAAVTGRDPSALREIVEGARCVECGSLMFLRAGGSSRRTCSHACRQMAYRRRNPRPRDEREVICQVCGKKMTISVNKEARRWCSQRCRQKAYRQRRSERPEEKALPEPSCGVCDTPLGPGSRRRWCSRRCSHQAYTRRRLDRGEPPRPSPPPDAPPRQQPTACAACAGPLEPGRNNQIRLTCSDSCRNKLYELRKKARLQQVPDPVEGR